MKFNQEQEAIIRDESSYIQVIAGAGAGKTSTMIGLLDRIIRKGNVNLEEMLVVTFSKKAAHEFLERLKKIHPDTKVPIQTFHAYCLKVLKNHYPEYRNRPPVILNEKEKQEFFRKFFIKHKFRVGGIPYKYLISDTDSFLPIIDSELYEEAIKEFQEFKVKNQRLEFSDLVKIFLEGLKNREPWTDEPKSKTRFIIVDEFQDTDFQQLDFLRSMEPDKLIVVGDDWQAIYGFRGATPEPFLRLDRYFHPLKRHFLSTNYRSLEKIVEISKIPILKNSNYIDKNLKANRKGKAELGILKLPEGRLGVEMVAKTILKNIQKGLDVKVLCRTNFRINEFKISGIPEEYLITIHGSKGLEFDMVFVDLLGGWNQKPDSLSLESLEEERRILYVALTRAKNSLYLIGREKPNTQKNLDDVFFSYFSKQKIPKTRFQVA